MNDFLQIIGSIASIGGIPLAIYLYLRSREAKFNKLRNEIVRILSYQIGEGRNLSVFEIKAVIDSKVREARGKSGVIEPDEIIEDLVSETISSPLLNSDRKNEILSNLRDNHRNSALFTAIDDKTIPWEKIIQCIQSHEVKPDETTKLVEICLTDAGIVKTKEKPSKPNPISEVFGLVAGIITIIATTMSLSGGEEFLQKFSVFFKENQRSFEFFIGVSASLIAAIVTAVFAKIKKDKDKKDS